MAEKYNQVLDELIQAFKSQQPEQFLQICVTNASQIIENFDSWKTVPEELHGSPERVKSYEMTILNIANMLERFGHKQPMKILPDENAEKIQHWDNLFNEVAELTCLCEFDVALGKIEIHVANISNASLPQAKILDFRSKLLGKKGVILFELKRFDESRAATTAALNDCKQAGDWEGVEIYTNNLKLLETSDPANSRMLETEYRVLQAFYNARRMTDLTRFRSSNQLLRELLAHEHDSAQFVDAIRTQILGQMGFNEYMLGNTEAARDYYSEARILCSQRGDLQGVEVYTENISAIGGPV